MVTHCIYSFATCLFCLTLYVRLVPSSFIFTAGKVNLSGSRLPMQWVPAGEMHPQIKLHRILENESTIPKQTTNSRITCSNNVGIRYKINIQKFKYIKE